MASEDNFSSLLHSQLYLLLSLDSCLFRDEAPKLRVIGRRVSLLEG